MGTCTDTMLHSRIQQFAHSLHNTVSIGQHDHSATLVFAAGTSCPFRDDPWDVRVDGGSRAAGQWIVRVICGNLLLGISQHIGLTCRNNNGKHIDQWL